jgi:hypothetical protein
VFHEHKLDKAVDSAPTGDHNSIRRAQQLVPVKHKGILACCFPSAEIAA